LHLTNANAYKTSLIFTVVIHNSEYKTSQLQPEEFN